MLPQASLMLLLLFKRLYWLMRGGLPFRLHSWDAETPVILCSSHPGFVLLGILTDNSSAATRIVSSERGLASCSVLMTAIRSWVISSTSFCGKERMNVHVRDK